MFIYAHRRRLYTAEYYLHRCTFNYLARIIVERLADTRFIDRERVWGCVCGTENEHLALGKFERIMEYVDIVLCIRKICTVQMEDLTLGAADVRIHREEICVKWVFFFFFIRRASVSLIISDYFEA